MMYITTRR